MHSNPSIENYLSSCPLESINLTLAGTGINVCAQVPILAGIGKKRISQMGEVNIASGSSYSYLVLFAYEKKLLIENNYLNVDQYNRSNHRCSLLFGLYRLSRYALTKKSFFSNHLIDDTSTYTFHPDFYRLTLSDLPENVRFWAYCNKKKDAVEISVRNGFGYMSVSQVFRACISIRFFHGYYYHKKYIFGDINFSLGMRKFKKIAKNKKKNNIIVNFNVEKKKDNTLYVKHSKSSRPKMELFKDFSFFLFNVPNNSIKNTHVESMRQLRKEITDDDQR